MSVFWNKRTNSLIPYVPGEQPRDREFIKLNTNENPYPPSPNVVAAIEETLSGGDKSSLSNGERLRLYPDPLCTGFTEAVAAAYGVNPSQVFPGNGSDEVLAFAFGAFFESRRNLVDVHVNDASAVLFPDITYSFYPVYANLWDIPFKTIPLQEDFSINLDDYNLDAYSTAGKDLCIGNSTADSGGVIIPNPNAPTGRALPVSPLLQLARKLEQNHRVLIVDEAYIAFGAESLVPYIADYPNLLTVHTLSKSASLAGLRTGFAIGSEELIEGLFRIRNSFNSYTLDAFALAGGAAAVLDKSYYDRINKKVIATRERTAAALLAMGFKVIPSKANFLFVSFPGRSGSDLFQALRDRGILVRHFNKPRIDDYLRVSIGTDKDMDVFLAVCKDITDV